MALPTKTDLQKMDWAYQGQPFVNVPAKSTVNLATMDYAFQGQPFVGNLTAAEGGGPSISIIMHHRKQTGVS